MDPPSTAAQPSKPATLATSDEAGLSAFTVASDEAGPSACTATTTSKTLAKIDRSHLPNVDTDPESEYTRNLTYNDAGIAVYTDPGTKQQFQFDTDQQQWIPLRDAEHGIVDATTVDPYENEHYRWCHETGQWFAKVQPSDATETEHYRFDAVHHQWIPKASAYNVTSTRTADGEQLFTYTDADDAVFFWDAQRTAWFPKIDDDFMARYQMGYGNYERSDDDEDEDEEVALLEKLLASKQKDSQQHDDVVTVDKVAVEKIDLPDGEARPVTKRKAEPPTWFDLSEEKNTKVYVSNLPTDITEIEFIELMSKYGMIVREPGSNKMKVKLYADAESGQLKGDGLCDFIRLESVEMALKLLDGTELRGCKIHVERAKFQMRGQYNPSLKPKKKKKDKERMRRMQEKLFDWRPDKMRGERSKHERSVIIKNLFATELFEREVHLILDYQNDLREECTKCGTVRKVIIYDQHPDGVAQVNMSDPEEADLVVQMMNKRFFGKRQLLAELWDGKTKYKIEETTGDEGKRLANWDQFLVNDNGEADDANVGGKANATNTSLVNR